MRPDHAGGASTERDSPEASAKPVVESGGDPALDRSPGHTVYPQEFVSVNVADAAPAHTASRVSNIVQPRLDACKKASDRSSSGVAPYRRVSSEGETPRAGDEPPLRKGRIRLARSEDDRGEMAIAPQRLVLDSIGL
jgi:hypothetical protein